MGDVDGSRKVDLVDVFAVASAFGSHAGEQRYKSNLDIDGDGKLNLKRLLCYMPELRRTLVKRMYGSSVRHKTISVVIPTFKEGKFIEKTLSCISKAEDVEIIVVDSDSNDETVGVAKRYTDKVFVMHERGISKAKNFGAAKAIGSIIVFIDADLIVPSNFAEKVRNAAKESVVGATCNILPIEPKLKEQVFLTTHNIVNKLLLRCPLPIMRHSRGEFMAVKKAAFAAVNGFNTELPCFEDHDLTVRLTKLGKFIFIDDLTVYESMRRIRKWGIPKTLFVWSLNFVTYIIKRKAYSQVWTPVR